VVGETGFEPEIPSTQTHGYPRFLQDRDALVSRLCVSVQCYPAKVAAVRDGTPSAVIADVSQMPMVATRRLQLVAADADIPVLTLRCRRNREQDLLADPARLVDVVAGGSGADAVFRTRAC
jgi:hypothetical protein